MSFVQRFGGALNLNPHVHSLLPDGLFVPGDKGGTLTFVPLPESTSSDIEALTYRIAHRLTAVVERLCADECETQAVLERTSSLVLEPTELLHRLAALVPAPYANLVRYHGVFASRSRWRPRLPEPPDKEAVTDAQPRAPPEPENQRDDGAWTRANRQNSRPAHAIVTDLVQVAP